jgi:hypothetical protein
MYRRTAIAALALLPLVAGCRRGTHDLFEDEIDFLAEDVIELMTIAFQVGENAWVGDPVFLEDVVEEAGPGNDFTAVYDLPDQPRIGLGFGFGRATVRIDEDGVPVADPLSLSLGATTALTVEITYTIQYQGETATGRLTDLDFLVIATATRAGSGDPFVVDYFLDGDTYLGATFCALTTEKFPGIRRSMKSPPSFLR